MGPVFPSPQVDNGYDVSDYRDDPSGECADYYHWADPAPGGGQ